MMVHVRVEFTQRNGNMNMRILVISRCQWLFNESLQFGKSQIALIANPQLDHSRADPEGIRAPQETA